MTDLIDTTEMYLRTILELEEDEGIWEESEYLVGAESKMITKIEPLALEVELVANGYQDCGCATCEAMNVDCENCPVCSPINSAHFSQFCSVTRKSYCSGGINALLVSS